MMIHPLPSSKYLWLRLDYDPGSGSFTWKPKPDTCWQNGMFNTKFSGKCAGDNGEHPRINIDGIKYQAHRIAWKMMTGEDPSELLDHADGDPTNNRFRNLRDANNAENKYNERLRKDSKSGYKGVQKRRDHWVARISIDNKRIYLGYFVTPEEAHAAYCTAAIRHAAEFARFR